MMTMSGPAGVQLMGNGLGATSHSYGLGAINHSYGAIGAHTHGYGLAGISEFWKHWWVYGLAAGVGIGYFWHKKHGKKTGVMAGLFGRPHRRHKFRR